MRRRRQPRLCLWGHRRDDLVLCKRPGVWVARVFGGQLPPYGIWGYELQRDMVWLVLPSWVAAAELRPLQNADRRP